MDYQCIQKDIHTKVNDLLRSIPRFSRRLPDKDLCIYCWYKLYFCYSGHFERTLAGILRRDLHKILRCTCKNLLHFFLCSARCSRKGYSHKDSFVVHPKVYKLKAQRLKIEFSWSENVMLRQNLTFNWVTARERITSISRTTHTNWVMIYCLTGCKCPTRTQTWIRTFFSNASSIRGTGTRWNAFRTTIRRWSNIIWKTWTNWLAINLSTLRKLPTGTWQAGVFIFFRCWGF